MRHKGGSDARQSLPLTNAAFHVLLALADADRHGYGIIIEVAAATEGEVRLRTGTLYTIVRRLLDGGLVAESDARPDPEEDDERRRYYRITTLGRAALQAEAARLARVVELARAKRALPRVKAAGSRAGGR